MFHVLFVCTGNTCRSCMAEALLKKAVESDTAIRDSIFVSSAGIAANEEDRASSNAVKVLKDEYSIILDHHSKKLTAEMLKKADLVLTMSISHRNFILNAFPEMSNKVYTLKQYVYADMSLSRNMDINDPFMGDEYVYKKSCKEIKDAVDKLLIKLKTNI